MPQLPIEYSHRMQQLLGNEYPAYLQALKTEPPVSIRINPQKIKTELTYEHVAWCNYGYYLPKRPVFTFDPAFQAGAYYVQEASSMFIGYALQQLISPGENIKVLDLCAAPGGKSTQVVSIISPESLLVANEVIKSRVGVLKENLEKWGHPNVVITHNDPVDFEPLEGFFDLVVCDAPCSGEGLFRKEPEAIGEWGKNNVELCCQRQQRILVSAIKTLKPGGHLIYSTCTHAREENEDNVVWMCGEFGMDEIKITLPANTGILHHDYGYRFYPHKVKGEGLYCAVLQKRAGEGPPKENRPKHPQFIPSRTAAKQLATYFNPEMELSFFEKNNTWNAFPANQFEHLNTLAAKLKIVAAGTEMGEFIRDELIPAQALAHSVYLNPDAFETLELSIEDAIKYLRKDPVTDPGGVKGWKLATFNGLGLGFLKNLGNRTNNYFPKERRILRNPSAEETVTVFNG